MASRKPSVRHPSHSHPLRGHNALAEEEIICSGCDLDLIGAAFKCTKSECDYFLHKSCFSLPPETRHEAHPDHPLTLFYSSPYGSSGYECSACTELGTAFVYNCSICQFDLHVGCISLPKSVKREEHEHPLTLRYCSPYRNCKVFQCHICQEIVSEHLWSYYCKECNYGTHLHFCEAEEKVEPKRGGRGGEKASTSGNKGGGRGSAASELAAMLEAQREMERMQIELHIEMQRAKMAKKARKACLKNI